MIDLVLDATMAGLADATGIAAVVEVVTDEQIDPDDRMIVTQPLTGDFEGLSWVLPRSIANAFAQRALGGAVIDSSLEADAALALTSLLADRCVEVLARSGIDIVLAGPPQLVTSVGAGTRGRLATPDGPVDIVLHETGDITSGRTDPGT